MSQFALFVEKSYFYSYDLKIDLLILKMTLKMTLNHLNSIRNQLSSENHTETRYYTTNWLYLSESHIFTYLTLTLNDGGHLEKAKQRLCLHTSNFGTGRYGLSIYVKKCFITNNAGFGENHALCYRTSPQPPKRHLINFTKANTSHDLFNLSNAQMLTSNVGPRAVRAKLWG